MASKKNEETRAVPPPGQRMHRATFARDKRNGGYLIRVQGPHASRFAEREVPVTKKNGDESIEKLDGLIATGINEDDGIPWALYSFEQRPKEEDEVLF